VPLGCHRRRPAKQSIITSVCLSAPSGFDAFGLPAEQFAIQTGTHPAETTARNCRRFREQLQALGFSYDWDREISTTDPSYYKCAGRLARGGSWWDVGALPVCASKAGCCLCAIAARHRE
jgi:hypothetical protein